jgi:hypothetical protein
MININHKLILKSLERNRLIKKMALKMMAVIKTGNQNAGETPDHLIIMAANNSPNPTYKKILFFTFFAVGE